MLRIPDSDQDANEGNDAAPGDLDITSDVMIEGDNRVSISAQDVRLFQVHEGAHLALDQVALRDGYAHYSHAGGGAVFNQGSFRLTNGALFDNFGGIRLDDGLVVLTDATITGNQGSGVYKTGGSLAREGETVIRDNEPENWRRVLVLKRTLCSHY